MQSVFRNARLSLTAWYVIVIMAISLSFSVVVFQYFRKEINHSLGAQGNRFLVPSDQLSIPDWTNGSVISTPAQRVRAVNERLAAEATDRVRLDLLLANLAILLTSAIGGYVLAGQTLKPIEEVLDEHKRFVGDASHELKTPLTALKTSIEVGLRDKNMTLVEAKELLNSNLEDVETLQGLTTHLLTLNRYDAIAQPGKMSQVPLHSLASMVGEMVKKQYQHECPGASITIEGEAVIDGHKESVQELFTILLDNAVKYRREVCDIQMRIRRGTLHAYITVQDAGIGMTPSDMQHIFDRFYRASSSRTKVAAPNGHGLGLSIAKRIVEMHNGSISVASEPGVGTTFTVRLPLRQMRLLR